MARKKGTLGDQNNTPKVNIIGEKIDSHPTFIRSVYLSILLSLTPAKIGRLRAPPDPLLLSRLQSLSPEANSTFHPRKMGCCRLKKYIYIQLLAKL